VAADRVLHVTLASDRGGAEAVIETIAAGLDRSRFDPVLAVPRGSALAGSWRSAGWTVLETAIAPRLRDLAGGWALTRELEGHVRTLGIRVTHTHGTAAQIYGGRAAGRAGCPVVWQTHDTFHARWTGEGLLHRLAAAQRHDAVIAISRTVAESLDGHVPASQIEIIPNGVPVDRVAPVSRSAPGPCVVWCGRLQHWKGAHVFLDAAAQVRRAHPAARFAVVGGTMFGMEPDYPAALRRQAAALQLEDAVEWVGQVADARPWLAAAEVCVHSSIAPEPFGLVVAEAMMQARPVVAFRQGGPAEIVEDGETGVLVPPGDVAAMSQAIAALLSDRDRAARLGDAGRRRALTHFAAAGMVRRIESAYDRARA
jgi:glycosyltransferase involved in cell wall biosynthesis